MEWHRLKSEVAGWGNWSPLELGPFDVGQVETAAQRYLEALVELTAHCRNWPETVQWNLGKLSSASSQIAAAKLRELTTPIPALVAYLCEATANQAKAAQFEQDLEELGRQRQQVARVLRVTTDAASSVIQRLGPASALLSGLFNPNCTLSRARELLTDLAGVLQAAEDLLAQSSSHPKGVACLIPELTSGELQWRHLELLANCNPSPLDLPPNVKLRLARHVQEDVGRLDKARALAVEIELERQLQAEIAANVGRIEAWRSPEAICALRPLFSACADNSLGGARVGDLPVLLPLIQQLAASLDGQVAVIAECTKLPANVCFYAHLGKLHRLTEPQLRGPVDADWPWLAHARVEHLIAGPLLEFASALEPVQGEFRRLQESLSGLRLEEASLRATAATLSNAHGILREVGLVACTLGDVVGMAESTSKLESQLREARKTTITLPLDDN